MGRRLFLTYCMQCHGSAATGAKGFPNLTDNDWLWGGSPDIIQTSILAGRGDQTPGVYRMPRTRTSSARSRSTRWSSTCRA